MFRCCCVSGEKWYKRHLTYRIMNWPRHLSQKSVRAAVRTAFQLWSNVSGLVFQEVVLDAPTDIRLAFYEGEHNDGSGNAFDGPGQRRSLYSHKDHCEPISQKPIFQEVAR